MAKDRRKLQHIHSSIADRQPTPQTLEVGEIAVNNAAEKEFISLKNTDNKVVRISSDKQMITWMEKKEVMPYSGTVDNIHLDTNRSNIEIKLNQVVASNTVKHDAVNGATDIDGQPVNPSSDGGLTNGAGFAIDMSSYAMIGANPSFSSITVTHQSNLNGTTNISNGAGGNSLNITTTNVNVTGTNWTENISGRTTTIGTGNESLHVIGTTTEAHDGNVTINNKANVTETTTGNTIFKVSGETTIDGVKSITIQATDTTDGDVNIYAKDALTETGKTVSITGTDSATIKAATTTISGATTNVTGATTLNLSGGTINTNANTANTNATSAYTNISTATTVIGTANTTASTASLSGKTLTIDEKESISAKTPSLSVSATTINVTGTTNINGNTTVNGTFSASTSVTTPLLSATTISADVIHTESGLENPLSWSYGSVTNATAGSYNASGATGFTIPKTISDVSAGIVTSNASGLNVDGTITATGAIYSSDINLKENVQNVDYPTYANANGVAIRKFNFKNDETKRTVYGVIAQEVEIAGLEDIVVVKDDGFKGVDYTALSLLKIAYLENKVKELEAMIKKLTEEK